jgi:heme-degrading monooxygenase HmoA
MTLSPEEIRMAFPCDHDGRDYIAVIFSSVRTSGDGGYEAMSLRMEELARVQPGFLGMESVRDAVGRGITVSYWTDEESIARWKRDVEHTVAQELGRSRWYESYALRVCRVLRTGRHP